MSFLQDVFSTLLDQRQIFRSEKDKRDISELCISLMSEQGELSGTKIASAVLAKYETLDLEEKGAFFTTLAEDYDLDAARIIEAAEAYSKNQNRLTLEALTKASESKRRELMRRLNQVPGATEKLVHMREDLFKRIRERPEFEILDSDFEQIFSAWFNRGFLLLKSIDWRTPANILEKIIEYEAVHAINDWDDLRRRLQPSDRRCFAFFHPVMPEEPLIFVEVALTKGIPDSIKTLLADRRDVLNEASADTAVFYSISNCQSGLKGVSFGNFLIKQVVEDIAMGLPNIKNFVTLSPVPGFVRWLSSIDVRAEAGEVQIILDKLKTMSNEDMISLIDMSQKPLTRLMAKYMLEAKNGQGFPSDPVSRFHLGNGASLERINWKADISDNGVRQSMAMMVNYRYSLRSVERNHESYVNEKKVHAAKEVLGLTKE